MNIEIPQSNLKAYEYLFQIENGLREFIIDSFERSEGKNWFKNRLPSDLHEKYKDGIRFNRLTPWNKLIPHHPIYYIDFPDLNKIIINKNNWKDVFNKIFKRKDLISSSLSELEPIRNNLAHNRKINDNQIKIIEIILDKLSSSIGEEKFYNFVNNITVAEDLYKQLNTLYIEAKLCLEYCIETKKLDELKNWEKIKNNWWFDSSYLDNEINNICLFFELIECYSKFERRRGTGHKIKQWVIEKNIEKIFINAEVEFTAILEDWKLK